MDPLSVTASIVGILAAAGKIAESLRVVISTAKEAPWVITALLAEVNDVHAVVSSLQTLLSDLQSAPPRRAALIQLDRLIATLTDTVLTFSELEAIVTPLAVTKGQKFPLRTRLKWTRVEGNCSKIVEKLQRHKSSISLMLNIFQCSTDAEAARSQETLELLVEQLLESNKTLCKRLNNLEDTFDARSTIRVRSDGQSIFTQEDNATITTARSANGNQTSILEAIKVRFAFDEDLQSSRVYSRIRDSCCDRSFVSSAIRTHAWSVFSGLSLADISIISVVALPLYREDVRNQDYYVFGDNRAADPGEPTGIWTNSQSLVQVEHSGDLEESLSRLTMGNAVHELEEQSVVDGSPVQSPETNTLSDFALLSCPDVKEAVRSSQDYSYLPVAPQDDDGYSSNSRASTPTNTESANELSTNTSLSGDRPESSVHSSETYIDSEKNHDETKSRITYEGGIYPCKGCGELLEEGKAFELAGNKWHIECFRCDTCGTMLDSDANLLLLGDGSLICNNCTYSCNSCGNKIEELAILTGDQAFCADCFRCRNCKTKIENLRYARTSQGIFCMRCHESLLARRRRKEREIKEKAAREKEALSSEGSTSLPPPGIQYIPPDKGESSAHPLAADTPLAAPETNTKDPSRCKTCDSKIEIGSWCWNCQIPDPLFPPKRSTSLRPTSYS
ncbi:hypothetical protein BCR34DRAFT_570096 [Clohesyomyces aquaticus]|uniref:LIM zinc-binding domain-containing protein n=1 Tax=Clohesyomyces aquaticus TaxID=1231657 RepID=A0A1Y1ZD57_9PLEO|nr:hypothetical protein BCR34DRAFT_570096 [Clohesyomyces aquaticus]